MIAYAALGLLVLIGLWAIARAFADADPRFVAKVARIVGVVVLVVAVVMLAVTGRLGSAAIAASFLVPMVMRWRAIWNRVRAAAGPRPGQRSAIETPFLAMTLDHDTGALAGTVRAGPFAGRDLASLSIEEAAALWRFLETEDADSARLIETWLDRVHGDAWRDGEDGGRGDGEQGPGAGRAGRGRGRAGGAASGRSGRMTPEEAREILEVAPDADAETIRAAHHRLMMANHPDRGGSTYLAAKINEARDVLLAD